MTVCSEQFIGLGRAQQKALGFPGLAITVVPHPFGTQAREALTEIARDCAAQIAQHLCDIGSDEPVAAASAVAAVPRALLVEAPLALGALNQFYIERRWGDGLPIVPPTVAAVDEMLQYTTLARDTVVATIAPGFGVATVEYIAINAVMAGCLPQYLPVLIAAARAVATTTFHLQAIQATTNPAAVWLVVNGPIAKTLGVNAGSNCLGQGVWANATLGRALRLMLQNIGRALPGEMDRSTQGQPGKYLFCCAENEAASPWEPLHVERGFAATESTVTVVGALGTWSMNMTASAAEDVLFMIAETMQYPASSDYVFGGHPFILLSPQHAKIFAAAGWSKAEFKQRLWAASKMPAGRSRGSEFERTVTARQAELGQIGPETLLPITVVPEDIGVIVAGGTGSHSVFVPVSAHTQAVTCAITA